MTKEEFCEKEVCCLSCYQRDQIFNIYPSDKLCPCCNELAGLTENLEEQFMNEFYERMRLCEGCQEGLLNQQGHMRPGGCLFE